MHKTTRALVLREIKYKEADKIMTVLTEDEGKLTVSARGVMRAGSKFAAACQFLCFSEMTLYERMGKWYLKEAQTVEQFLGLREDLGLLALGTYIAELLEAVSDEDSPNPEVLSLGLNTLYSLSRKMYSAEHIKAAFELRLMCLSGYEPALDCCGVCGQEPEKPCFSTLGGTVLCSGCKRGEHGETFPLCGESLAAMRAIEYAGSKDFLKYKAEDEAAKRLYAICEAYVTAQLERRFSALDYWKSVK